MGFSKGEQREVLLFFPADLAEPAKSNSGGGGAASS
jgi:hypothetical protein